jgi:hypothetical protein
MSGLSKSAIRTVDMPIIDKVFEMEGGWCLNFSDRTYAAFFNEELGVDIDHPRFSVEGGSKGKRTRYYLKNCDRATALRTLNALWDYRRDSGVIHEYAPLEDAVIDAYQRILERLGAKPAKSSPSNESNDTRPIPDPSAAQKMSGHFLQVSQLEPQARGYAFEKFLKDFFDAYGLMGRASFRLAGEQIDGSFVLDGETYLLEAKWTNALVDVGTLRSFNAKVEDKASWTRGLIVSQNGFSKEGLAAFGPGKSLICMDGFDICETLNQGLNFADVIAAKVRRAAETGKPHISVRELIDTLSHTRAGPAR